MITSGEAALPFRNVCLTETPVCYPLETHHRPKTINSVYDYPLMKIKFFMFKSVKLFSAKD